MIRVKFIATKMPAMVLRNSDFPLKVSLRALTMNGPPMPNSPVEMPPVSNKTFRSNVGNFMLSKKITLAESMIAKAPKSVSIVCESILLKIKTPIIVPRKQTGMLCRKIFFEKDLWSVMKM